MPDETILHQDDVEAVIAAEITEDNALEVTVEKDADGERIVIKDVEGVIKGYVGWSESVGSVVFWPVDTDILNPGTDVFIQLHPQSLFIQGPTGAYIDIDGTGKISILPTAGQKLQLLQNGIGVDGTATPATAGDLADVLVDLGVIESHTIPYT